MAVIKRQVNINWYKSNHEFSKRCQIEDCS
jgi:hypothetical protein